MSEAKFIKTATAPRDYPVIRNGRGVILPEIAVVGRSNVGKSTLLNHLFQRKNLVKTSSTPGKTQALNFFTWDERWAFADLPGYGYARVPLSVRQQWAPMIQAYVEERQALQLMLFLMDIRRVPGADDLRCLDWAVHYQKSVILVLTKTDLVTPHERESNAVKIIEALRTGNLHYVHYSSKCDRGRRELLAMIEEALCDAGGFCSTPREKK